MDNTARKDETAGGAVLLPHATGRSPGRYKIFALLLAAAAAVALYVDFSSQQEAVDSISSQVSLVEDRLRNSSHDASSLASLRGLLNEASDRAVLLDSRWIGDERTSIFSRIDETSARLTELEGQAGLR